MAEWQNGPYLRGGVRIVAFLEQQNAVFNYPSNGRNLEWHNNGIRNETLFTSGIRCTRSHAELE